MRNPKSQHWTSAALSLTAFLTFLAVIKRTLLLWHTAAQPTATMNHLSLMNSPATDRCRCVSVFIYLPYGLCCSADLTGGQLPAVGRRRGEDEGREEERWRGRGRTREGEGEDEERGGGGGGEGRGGETEKGEWWGGEREGGGDETERGRGRGREGENRGRGRL